MEALSTDAAASVEVIVKYSAGAYTTQTVRGKRASSTCSAAQAAQRLGRKLWGYEPEVQAVGRDRVVNGHLVEVLRLMPQRASAGAA